MRKPSMPVRWLLPWATALLACPPTHLEALPLAARLPVAQLRKADGGVAVLQARRRGGRQGDMRAHHAVRLLRATFCHMSTHDVGPPHAPHMLQRTWDRSMPRKEVEVYQVAKAPTVAKPT